MKQAIKNQTRKIAAVAISLLVLVGCKSRYKEVELLTANPLLGIECQENEILYVTSDNQIVEFDAQSNFCGSLKMHKYENNYGRIVFDNSITSIVSKAFEECDNLIAVTLPQTVTSIGDGAFFDCLSLQYLNLPDGITSIGDSAFQGCENLHFDSMPTSLKRVGSAAFCNCKRLEAITLGNEVEVSTKLLFNGCESLKSVHLDGYIKEIGDKMFFGCYSLEEVTFPQTITTIGKSAFSTCYNLKSFVVPDSVTRIYDYAFYECRGMKSMVIGSGVTRIDIYAFARCGGELIVKCNIPNRNADTIYLEDGQPYSEYIGAFEHSLFTKATIAEGVTFIGSEAFMGSYFLEEVILPSTIKKIRYGAFNYCHSLKKIVCHAILPPSIGMQAMPKGNYQVVVPMGVNPAQWKHFCRRGGTLMLETVPNKEILMNEL